MQWDGEMERGGKMMRWGRGVMEEPGFEAYVS